MRVRPGVRVSVGSVLLSCGRADLCMPRWTSHSLRQPVLLGVASSRPGSHVALPVKGVVVAHDDVGTAGGE
jgi:hypothetical protein